jgi:hypothetical protein
MVTRDAAMKSPAAIHFSFQDWLPGGHMRSSFSATAGQFSPPFLEAHAAALVMTRSVPHHQGLRHQQPPGLEPASKQIPLFGSLKARGEPLAMRCQLGRVGASRKAQLAGRA